MATGRGRVLIAWCVIGEWSVTHTTVGQTDRQTHGLHQCNLTTQSRLSGHHHGGLCARVKPSVGGRLNLTQHDATGATQNQHAGRPGGHGGHGGSDDQVLSTKSTACCHDGSVMTTTALRQ